MKIVLFYVGFLLVMVACLLSVIWLGSVQSDYKSGVLKAQADLENRLENVEFKTAAKTLRSRANTCLEQGGTMVDSENPNFTPHWPWESRTANEVAAKKIWRQCMEAEIAANRIGVSENPDTQAFLSALSH